MSDAITHIEETPCPRRSDKQHCRHWYDGEACCACGDPPMSDEAKTAQGMPVGSDPVCLIHGKRQSEHEGGRCLYCCICFKPLTPDECAEDEAGQKWDCCKGVCAQKSGIGSGER